ncbi:REP13E12 repeat-containing protein [Mycobacterium tuberculosis]|nr:REP13E12 repeat-containing protein [Mycobacterium tuberculosis]
MDVSTRQAAEADLAGKAAQYRPDELARYAQRVMDWLHPDGDLTDTERARKRGITLSNQQYDGMSRLSGYLTPQARATFEAVLAKLAAPGATNPDDHTPVIDTTPDAAAIDRDTRSQAQRNHDGLLAGLRALDCRSSGGSEPIAPVHHCTGMGFGGRFAPSTPTVRTAQTDGTPLARMWGVFEMERK